MRSKSTVTVKRPANTTAYTAADVVGAADTGTPANAGTGIIEFRGIGAAGSLIELTSASLRIDLDAIPASMTTFRLYLFSESPAAILDNAAFLLPAGDRRAFVGYIDLGTALDLGSTLFTHANNIGLGAQLTDGSTSLFGVLVTAGGYTPASGTVHAVTLHAKA